MSAKIVDFQIERAKLNEKPAEYFAYIDMLQDAYPALIRAECVAAVDDWFNQKDVLTERLWADCEYINCALKVPVWNDKLDKIKATFIPTGIVFRAALLSQRSLMMTFAFELEGEDNDYYRVWHVAAADIGSIEELVVETAKGVLEDDPDDEEQYGLLNHPHLYSEDRLDAIRAAHQEFNLWQTKKATAARWRKLHKSPQKAFGLMSEEEQILFGDIAGLHSCWQN